MYTVGIDTSHKFLVIALIQDDKLIGKTQLDCFKQQSEYLIPEFKQILEKHNLEVEDIDNYVVTVGPGSYTGTRIGMTMVKVIGSLLNKDVYTLSTLQLYAGLHDTYVIMDARANRVYFGQYKNGISVIEDTIKTVPEAKALVENKESIVGDLHLLGLEDSYLDIANNFVQLKPYWKKVDNVDLLTPKYFKSNEDYL